MKSIKHLLPLLLLYSCTSQSPDEHVIIDPAFGEYISAYTAGVLSVHDQITVELATPYSGPETLPAELFTTNPKVSGTCHRADAYTLIFTPDEPLQGGTMYEVSFHLGKIASVSAGYEQFKFTIQTISQQISVYANGPEAYEFTDLTKVHIRGEILTADQVDEKLLNSAFSAGQSGKKLNILYTFISNTRFEFEIENALRGEKAGLVTLKWSGKEFGKSADEQLEIEVPALGDFKVLSAKMKSQPQQSVEIRFSDPIAEQKLGSIISLEGVSGISFTITGHVIEVFPDGLVNGARLLTVNEGLMNAAGKKMPEIYTSSILFEQEKPSVRMVGSKAIMPISQGLIIPFEAVALHAVDVYITKVFSNNILQYLQENELGGNYTYLNQIGRHIYKRKIDLRAASAGNIQSWQRYYVDLAEIVQPDPGAFYRVEVRFKPEYACYPCAENGGIAAACNDRTAGTSKVSDRSDGSTADGHLDPYYFVDDYYDQFSSWDWDNRDNPCDKAYYSRNGQRTERTFMATDMGLTAKMGGDRQMHFIVTDLATAKPIYGAQIEVFDYQQQLMATAKSNEVGFAIAKLPGEPFAAVATHGKHKTWLKLGEYNSLSLSKFEVEGNAVQDGVKGYIYGERGVWRPGDSLYLNFVMMDREGLLAKNHPVNFELRNPMGQVVQSFSKSKAVNGFYDFRTSTEPDAETGDYSATFRVGNRTYAKTLKIETVKPNRLKINFDFGKEIITAAKQITGNIEARWLHGASAAGLSAKVEMRIAPTRTTFDKWPRYQFDNNLDFRSDGSEQVIFEGKLDASGKATTTAEMGDKTKNAPGMMKLSFFTKVFEPGGNFSVDYHTVKYAPYSSFAGVRIPEGTMWGGALETNQNHTIELAVVDAEGMAVDRKQLEITLYKINSRWWFDRYDGDEYDYLGSDAYKTVKTEIANLSGGKGTYALKIDNNDWGRYIIIAKDPVSGHSSATFMYFDWPYWMRANRSNSEASTLLTFSSDKQQYNIGETIKLTFPSPENGRALVCIENGTKILEKFWVNTKAGETKVELPVTTAMTPNVFAHVMLLQPHAQTENDRPIKMFGVIPLSVEDPNTRLEPVIAVPVVLKPESKAEITISEANGQAMTYTLAVVDEGLLDLTRFKTPNPWNQFYAKEALGIKTWDMYDLVIGAFGQNISTLLSIGGDDEALDPSKQKAMRFKPMVRYLGPFELAKGKSAKHSIDVPNYLGSVRIMVVAGQDMAWGSAEKAVPVRKPLMVIGTLPRVLGPGEKVSLPANVFAMENHIKNVDLKVTTNALFKSSGSRTASLSFAKTGEAMANFELETTAVTGIGKVTIVATSGSDKSTYEIEIEVRNANPPYTTVRDTVLEAGAQWKINYKTFGMEGTNKAAIELSNMPPINLESRLEYLIGYPHGCLEQITSAAFPQLYLKQLTTLTAEKQATVDRNISETLKRLRSYQLSSGGMAYWPGNNYYSDWSTSYAGHFMLEAEARGYALPGGLKQSWIRYQTDAARKWNSEQSRSNAWGQRAQAYRLYTLAKASKPDIGGMNLLRERQDLDASAKWMLALAYAEAGQPEPARKLIETTPKSVAPYVELSNSFGSDIRDEAFLLLALLKLNMKADAAFTAKKIAEKMGNLEWYSTQTTSLSLCALATFIGGSPTNDGLKAKLINGNTPLEITTGKSMQVQNLSVNGGKGAMTLENKSKQMLFARLLITGQPLAGREERKEKNVKMEVRYIDANFKDIDPSKLKAGTDFIAEVKVYNPGTRGDLSEMALTQVFPSGWEILNQRLSDASGDKASTPVYQDIRDDRVMSYFNLARNEATVYRVRLNATYAGRYYLPATLCYAMYDETIMATEPGRWVEVVK